MEIDTVDLEAWIAERAAARTTATEIRRRRAASDRAEFARRRNYGLRQRVKARDERADRVCGTNSNDCDTVISAGQGNDCDTIINPRDTRVSAGQGRDCVTISAPQQARDRAEADYLAEHPEPGTVDVTCPRCAAYQGAPCYFKGRAVTAEAGVFHIGRVREAEDAQRRRNDAARAHGQIAYQHTKRIKENS